ncbi:MULTISPECIES: efflux RND transporter periplasmic adaptor subunit [Falsihalocynthiibacter]|uniref:efflux RND transporter periplasmic adaptor subunit n=1 Tax=Falsihalocynthiibacter TaxID=2854182 RepID=UPI00300168A6
MRPLPVISAILVSLFLFLLVFERDRLLGFAFKDDTPVVVEETVEAGDQPTSVAQIEAVDEVTDTQNASPMVSVVALRSVAQPVENAVLLRGQTEAARKVEIRSEVTGLIISEPLRKGGYIEKGQLLCEVEIGTRASVLADAEGNLERANAAVPEANARLAEANARLSEAKINDTAAKRLSEGGFASDTRVASSAAAYESALAGVQGAKASVSAAESGIKSAVARVVAAERDIERLRILAPFSGMLETDTAELGTLMQPGALCTTVVLLDPIKLVGFVPETDVERIKVGAMSGARLASGVDAVGRVSFLSRTADSATRTFRVEVIVPNADLAIRDGQTVEIVVSSAGSDAHLLPASSLTLNDEGALGVRVVEDQNVVKFLEVSVLRDSVDGIWVLDLPQEVSVITSGQEYVIDGVTVAVTYREPS